MKLGPVTKLDKKNTLTSKKKLVMMSFHQIVMSLLFFQFMANLEQSRSQIPDAWSVELTLSFENRTEKSLTQLSHYCFEYRYYFWQKMLVFFQKLRGLGTKKYIF